MANLWALTHEGDDIYGLFLADGKGHHYGQRIAQIRGENYAAMIRNAPDMIALFKEILDSDMAQREEDEGDVSPLLDKIRAILNATDDLGE